MCGFAGFRDYGGLNDEEGARGALSRMADKLVHRGPDDFGMWLDAEAGIALGHRRLSIIDLSPAGHQPMVSATGRYVIAFNGEIYNHLALRVELESCGIAPGWRGHSDTETLLAAFDAWGVEATLKACVGMFAIALWDRKARRLTLARDRLGEKPLYYGWQKGVLLFGSELKALRAHPIFVGEIDRDVLALFLRHNYIPAPYTIYRGIRKLAPGCFLEIAAGDEVGAAEIKPYWTLAEAVVAGQQTPFAGDEREAADALERVLKDAVRGQMMADVPLGAFLSGGIDSSMVVALMQAQSTRPIKTFTIGFHEAGYNEAVHAKSVARHLGTEHTELYVTPEQAQAVIPRIASLYDEPFSDSSQIPTFLVSELARRHVMVSLSGDGGDELFGGYSRYAKAHRIWGAMEALPPFMRQGLAKSVQMLSVENWNRLSAPVKPFLPKRMQNIGDKAHKFSELIAASSRMDFYRRFITHWSHPEDVVLRAREPKNCFSESDGMLRAFDFFDSMMLTDTLTYLPDDILVKVDRAAMGVSLETRVPFLDHRVVEFAWRLPQTMKIRQSQGKWLLRQILYKYVPKEMIERPKMGFGVPIGAWLRGPLRDWAESLLSESRLHQEGFLNPVPIRQKWSEHLSGQYNWQYHLWDVLMFQAWLEEQGR